jgi:hypothetical protein
VFSEDQDVSSQGEDSSRISRKIKNIISKLAIKNKVLQYAPKNKKTKGGADFKCKRHWNKCVNVNEWVGY